MLRRKVSVLRKYKNNPYKMSIKCLSSFIMSIIILWFWGISLADELYDKALQKYRAGEFVEARDLLIKKIPKDAGDHNLLGWVFLKSGDPSEAIRHFEHSLSLNPHLYDSYCGLGYSYFQQGIFEKALENFNKYAFQTRNDVDCLLGLGLTLERLQQKEKALEIFKEVLSIDGNNLIAIKKIDALSPQMVDDRQKEGTEFFARGNYLWIKRGNNKIEPVFIKGVNMGFALSGKFPSEFPENEETYLEWFKLIGEMNANLIRIYTILPPQFYSAFKKYNQNKKEVERLFLIQGIWTKLPEKSNFRNPLYMNEIKNEIKNAIDVIHGKANIQHRYGHAHGVYRSDVSDCVLGYIFGREWEPPEVIAYNTSSSENSFTGKYLRITNGSPMEVWLTELLDYLIGYEYERYAVQRPVALMNWPPLDPLYHQSEATFREEVEFRKRMGEPIDHVDYSKTFDEDAVSIDETKIIATKEYKAGIFASYHVYPYSPDFMAYEEQYAKKTSPHGFNYYYNYLKALKQHYRHIPLLVSEFGIPTSRGIARFHPEGPGHGGHTEEDQARILKGLFLNIREAGCAGGIVFSWIDEWFKTNWMVRDGEDRDQLWYNAEDPEENYGLMAVVPSGVEKLKGKAAAWNKATLLYTKEGISPLVMVNDGYDAARTIRRIYADHDAGYFYLRIDVGGPIDWGNVAYLIALDTIGDAEGDHKLPFDIGLESPIGFEFVILLHGEKSRILIDDVYNRMVFDQKLLKYEGLTGYKVNNNFKPVYNNNGIFTEIINLHRRRFSREGKVYPEKIYNASILREGNRADNNLADFYYSKEQNFIEVRIPWYVLNFSDPSQLKILFSEKEHKISSGIRVMAVSYKPMSRDDSRAVAIQDRTNAADLLPRDMSKLKMYTWQGWETPEYTTYLKRAYFAMKELYGNTQGPELKVHISAGFDPFFVVKMHYLSPDEFLKLYADQIPMLENAYSRALADLTYGLVTREPFYIEEARSLFMLSASTATDVREQEYARFGMQYAENILIGTFKKGSDAEVPFERILIEKDKPVVREFTKIIIGRSAIQLKKNAVVKTQVDRVTRDWLSAYNLENAPWHFRDGNTVPWHEGEKIQELRTYADAQVGVVWGTMVKKFGNSWYAPDTHGVYRFMLNDDKVYNYPTNFVVDDRTVIINDTHGISALAWDSLGADLVIGCGDHEGKIEAAYYLAQNGVHVYMPTDKELYRLIGTHTKGTIIGSAPIKKTSDGVVIGDQPVTIHVDEPIVVSRSDGRYPLHYYETPFAYFTELERFTGKKLNITPIIVREVGRADSVVAEARRIGAKLIGIRVWGKAEHDAVYAWLKEDKTRRAILFHSAVYPEGYRLFFEFPQQTSFGDINVYFE